MQTTRLSRNVPSRRWQDDFLILLPCLKRLLNHAFHHLDEESQEEAVQNALVICLLAYARLYARGQANRATGSTLAWYAVLQTKTGRVAGGQLNVDEPLSRYAQIRRGFKVKRLEAYNERDDAWINAILADKRASVPDIVATKLDFRSWLSSLSERRRRIAVDLAAGFNTSEAAQRFEVSHGRISQIRRALERSWAEFQHEATLVR